MNHIHKWIKASLLLFLTCSLAACGFHFQRNSDFSAALQRTAVTSKSNKTVNFSILLKRKMHALGLYQPTVKYPATATLTLISLRYYHSIPNITTSNQPQYIKGTSTLCFQLQRHRPKAREIKRCISQSDQIMVTFSTAFNPNTLAQLQNQAEQRLVETVINTLSSPIVTQQLER